LIDESPFTDVRIDPEGFSIPQLKWRELLFVGALRRDGGLYVRDPSRPMPAFVEPEPFPPGQRFRVELREGRAWLRRA
jgi:hypothetical protein